MDSFIFKNVYLGKNYLVVGPLEKESKLKKFNKSLNDYYFEEKTFEQAEIKMQKLVMNNLYSSSIDFVLGADLINQISISNYTARDYNVPFLGVYSACSSFTEELLIGSVFVDSYKLKNVIAITSSHNLTAERQYRFPVEYGSTRPHTATSTATGAAGVILTSVKTNIKVESATIGNVIDLGVSDVNHMGAAMAPAAAHTLNKHLLNLNRDINHYDVIVTGDLGKIGLSIFKEYIKNEYNLKCKKIIDAGSEIYLDSSQTYAGGSGPVCLPLILFSNILNNYKYKKILLLATGALHSPSLVNQKNTIPAISHAISLEVL